ncbi:MAG: sulfatase [Saprospiraceae bacterium]|nr:sulfatase [Saprospiraceae bacterium]
MNNLTRACATYAFLVIGWIFLVIVHTNCASRVASTASKRPNVIWIIPDDMSANFSCYGETAIQTPHVDRLAARGVKFTNAYVTAPVCSPCRSAFITGMYQTTIGSHHHRSGRGVRKIALPEGVKLVPQLFKDAGYFTTLSGWPISPNKLGKSDYNFEWDTAVYNGSDWSQRKEGQPFFAQIQTPGGKLRGAHPEQWEKVCEQAAKRLGSQTPSEAVDLPPYYPPDPDIVKDWQAYLESVRLTDAMVGEVIERLKAEGVLDNSYVLFMTDHGISHARGKQFLYDEGIHVPLIITGPDIPSGSIREDLVEHIDIAALSLGLAGIEVPKVMQGRHILGPDYIPREAVFAARDRCDETIDHIRSVRTQRYKYIRNFLSYRPYLQPNAYKDAKAILIALRRCKQRGELDDVQMLHFSQRRPMEELYDLSSDPYEIHNLAEDPGHGEILLAMRQRLDSWMEETDDKGRQSESIEMYDSDMALYLDRLKGRFPKRLQVIEENIALMKKWSIEGR